VIHRVLGLVWANLTCGVQILAQEDTSTGITRSLYANIEDNTAPGTPLYQSAVWMLIPDAGSYASHDASFLYHHHLETSIEDSHTTSNWGKVTRVGIYEDPCILAIDPPATPPPSPPPPSPPPPSPPPPTSPPPASPPGSPPRSPPKAPSPSSPPSTPPSAPPSPKAPPPTPPVVIPHKNPGEPSL
jgi:hypothetical protein